MDGFDALTLPQNLATHIRREVAFRTDIVATASGAEHRNAGWAQGRRRFVLDAGPLSLDAAREIEAFFEARQGRQRGFLVQDWLRPHSGTGVVPDADDVALTAIDAARREFAITLAGRRNIMVREEGFLLAMNGRRMGADSFALDGQAGQVHMTVPVSAEAALTAGFFFDMAVRFDVDQLAFERIGKDMVRLAPVPIIEINVPSGTP